VHVEFPDGAVELVFAGPNTTEHFCQWLFSGENEGATVIAHNFKGYDSLPILEYLYQNGVKPTFIAKLSLSTP
jgi:acylphosphatase